MNPEQSPFIPHIKLEFPPPTPEERARQEYADQCLRNLIKQVIETYCPHVEQIMGLPEAAKALNVKPSTLRKMCYQGRIGYISDGKNLKFKVTDLNRYIDEHYTPELTTKNAKDVQK